MKVRKNISLKRYNTFGIDAMASDFVRVRSVEELREVLQWLAYPEKIILGGGSNILLTGDVTALVVHMDMHGIGVVYEDENDAVVKAMGGENWHQLVLWTLDRDYGGLQNLSLIPGNAGTAPMQNIGAYGVELKDVFESCEAMDRETLELVTFSKDDCRFGYRESFFKKEGRGKFILTSLSLRLTKRGHLIQTGYGDIAAELAGKGIADPTIRDVSDAVTAIRRRKLPDPEILGNSGSFFKNPVLSEKAFRDFREHHPEAPFYQVSDVAFKVPAGWLIEKCGFKGKRFGDAGVHDRQALVLVNHGKATGMEILELARNIREAVFTAFNVAIEPEVNIIGGNMGNWRILAP